MGLFYAAARRHARGRRVLRRLGHQLRFFVPPVGGAPAKNHYLALEVGLRVSRARARAGGEEGSRWGAILVLAPELTRQIGAKPAPPSHSALLSSLPPDLILCFPPLLLLLGLPRRGGLRGLSLSLFLSIPVVVGGSKVEGRLVALTWIHATCALVLLTLGLAAAAAFENPATTYGFSAPIAGSRLPLLSLSLNPTPLGPGLLLCTLTAESWPLIAPRSSASA